ncbi:MAG: hypothetical protein ACK55Z_14275 [bacterium]
MDILAEHFIYLIPLAPFSPICFVVGFILWIIWEIQGNKIIEFPFSLVWRLFYGV